MLQAWPVSGGSLSHLEIQRTSDYGLATSGLPVGGLATIRAVYMRQLRAIVRCPAHLSKLSNRDVPWKAGVPDVGKVLRQEMDRRGGNVRSLSGFLTTCNISLTLCTSWLVGTHTLGHVDGVESSEQLCSCRFCSRYFSTHVLCRAHESMQHQQRSDPTAGPAFVVILMVLMVCLPVGYVGIPSGNGVASLTHYQRQCPVLTGHLSHSLSLLRLVSICRPVPLILCQLSRIRW